MATPKAKFHVGEAVNHPAAPDGSFPLGTGTVESVTKGPDGFVYKIRCDRTGDVLEHEFAESDLTAC